MDKWEYKLTDDGLAVELGTMEDRINEISKDGWELDMVIPEKRDMHNRWYVFKRKLPVEEVVMATAGIPKGKDGYMQSSCGKCGWKGKKIFAGACPRD